MEKVTKSDIQKHKPKRHEGRIGDWKELFTKMVGEYRQDPKSLLGWPCPSWPVFNQAFGGSRPGEMIILTSETGEGKTTFAMNWAMEMAMAKYKPFLISLEVRWNQMSRIIAQRIAGKRFVKFTDTEMAFVGDMLNKLDGCYLDETGMMSFDYIQKAIEYACEVKKCRFVLLDHFDYIRRASSHGSSDAKVVGDMIRELSATAKRTGATLLVIVHPSKLESKGIKTREIGMDELKGSSSHKQEADAVISIYRPRPNENESVLRFQKIRDSEYGRYKNSFVRFEFDFEKLSYLEKSKSPEWGKP